MPEEIKDAASKKTRLRKYLYVASAAILLAGFASAAIIYRIAANSPDDSGYDIVGGFVYPGGGAYNKKYIHDLQLYGGSSAVLADQFTRWFDGLWHGESLACTVAVIALVLSFGFFVAARNVQLHSTVELRRENRPDETA